MEVTVRVTNISDDWTKKFSTGKEVDLKGIIESVYADDGAIQEIQKKAENYDNIFHILTDEQKYIVGIDG